MITKAQVKHIQSLDDKKNRNAFKEFIVEGDKMVRELLNSKLKIHHVYAVEAWVLENKLHLAHIDFTIVESFELQKLSLQQHPNQVLALAALPEFGEMKEDGVHIVLAGIQDPGNLGSIIRIADWFGLSGVYCSLDSVDYLNHKVV